MQRRDFITGALAIAAAASAVRLVSADELTATDAPKPFRFMSFTILSSGATIRAWNDNDFKKAVFADPTSVLRRYWGDKHQGLRIVLHENSENVRHFPLPFKSQLASTLRKADLLKELEYETGGDTTLQHFLPADVIAEALVNEAFRERLTKAPNSTLAAVGYELPGVRIVIHANTDTIHHLALPGCPVDTVQLVSSEGKLRDYIVAVSSTCCASGTCDDDMCLGCHTPATSNDKTARPDPNQWPSAQPDDTQPDRRPLKEYLKSTADSTEI